MFVLGLSEKEIKQYTSLSNGQKKKIIHHINNKRYSIGHVKIYYICMLMDIHYSSVKPI